MIFNFSYFFYVMFYLSLLIISQLFPGLTS